jgi:hypothetical protein
VRKLKAADTRHQKNKKIKIYNKTGYTQKTVKNWKKTGVTLTGF